MIFEAYCVGGRFDFHLDGTIGEVTFNDAHVILEGGVCLAEPEGECPAQ